MKALHEHLAQVGDVQLRWNVVGVGDDGTVDPERFSIHLFAVDFSKGKGAFDAPLTPEEIRKLHSFLTPFVQQLPDSGSATPLRVVEAQGDVGEMLDLLVGLEKPGLTKISLLFTRREDLSGLQRTLDRLKVKSLRLRFATREGERRLSTSRGSSKRTQRVMS